MIDLIIKWAIPILATIVLLALAGSLVRIQMEYWYMIRKRQLIIAIIIYLAILGIWMLVYYPKLTIL